MHERRRPTCGDTHHDIVRPDILLIDRFGPAFRTVLGPLFRPVSLGPLKAGNRLCIQPMEGCDGTLDGQPDELTFRRYRRFGAGGANVIWGEATAVVREPARAGRNRCIASAARPG